MEDENFIPDISNRNWHWDASPFRIDNTSSQEKKPAPKIPHGPMFHDDSNSDQVEENENDISGNKPHFNTQTQESAKKKSPKIPEGTIYHDDSKLDYEENENAIYVISGNGHHPFSPQIQESNL